MLLSLRHIIHGLTFLALRGGGLEVVNTHTSDKNWNRKLMKSNKTCSYYEHFDWWFFVLHKFIISDIERKRERGGVYMPWILPSLGGYEYRCFLRDKMTYVLSESTLHIYAPYLDEKYNKDVLSVNIKGSYTTCF